MNGGRNKCKPSNVVGWGRLEACIYSVDANK